MLVHGFGPFTREAFWQILNSFLVRHVHAAAPCHQQHHSSPAHLSHTFSPSLSRSAQTRLYIPRVHRVYSISKYNYPPHHPHAIHLTLLQMTSTPYKPILTIGPTRPILPTPDLLLPSTNTQTSL